MSQTTEKVITISYITTFFVGLVLGVGGALVDSNVTAIVGLAIMILNFLVLPLRGLFKPFACAMGWHAYSSQWQVAETSDPYGFQSYSKCPWCGREGFIDSQGNLCA